MTRIIPSRVRVDATALVIYYGQPLTPFEVVVTSGSATVELINFTTDSRGIGLARINPSAEGALTVEVRAGA